MAAHPSPENPLLNAHAPENLTDKYNDIVERSPESITMINRDYVYVIANDSYCRTLGKPQAEIVGKTVEAVWGRERFETVIKQHLDTCFEGESVSYEERFGIGASERVMHVSFYPHEESGRVSHALVFSTDTTQIRALETRLKEYQFKDPTTGLLNRRSLNVILQNEIDKARRSKSDKLRAVLLISLGNFTRINQAYGHHVGDVLLENSGLRIKETLRKADLAFRFEGDAGDTEALGELYYNSQSVHEILKDLLPFLERAEDSLSERDEITHRESGYEREVTPFSRLDSTLAFREALSANAAFEGETATQGAQVEADLLKVIYLESRIEKQEVKAVDLYAMVVELGLDGRRHLQTNFTDSSEFMQAVSKAASRD